MASSEISSRGLAAMARASSSLRNSIRVRWAERHVGLWPKAMPLEDRHGLGSHVSPPRS